MRIETRVRNCAYDLSVDDKQFMTGESQGVVDRVCYLLRNGIVENTEIGEVAQSIRDWRAANALPTPVTYRCPKCGSLNLECEYSITLRLGDPEEGEEQGPILDDFDQVNGLEPEDASRMSCRDCTHSEQAWTFVREDSTNES